MQTALARIKTLRGLTQVAFEFLLDGRYTFGKFHVGRSIKLVFMTGLCLRLPITALIGKRDKEKMAFFRQTNALFPIMNLGWLLQSLGFSSDRQ